MDEISDGIKQKTFLDCADNQTQIVFQGVRFNCNSKIGSKIEIKEYLKSPLLDETHKPDYVHPSYLSFNFKNGEDIQERGSDYYGEISVYPIEEFRQMYSIAGFQGFDESLAYLKKTIFTKQARQRDYFGFLMATDGQFGFKSHLKYGSFKNGKGVGFVTQVQMESTIISNEELVWVFEGLTNDGKYYIRAAFPIRAGFLPEKVTDEFEGYSMSDYSRLSKRYEQYLSLVSRRLDSLPSTQYQPNLDNLVNIISSLEAK